MYQYTIVTACIYCVYIYNGTDKIFGDTFMCSLRYETLKSLKTELHVHVG